MDEAAELALLAHCAGRPAAPAAAGGRNGSAAACAAAARATPPSSCASPRPPSTSARAPASAAGAIAFPTGRRRPPPARPRRWRSWRSGGAGLALASAGRTDGRREQSARRRVISPAPSRPNGCGRGGVPSPAGPAMTSIDAADLAELARDLAGLAGGGSFRVVVEAGGRRVELAAGPAESRPFIAKEAAVTSTDGASKGPAGPEDCNTGPAALRSPSRGAAGAGPADGEHVMSTQRRRPSGPVRPIQRPVRTRAGTPAAVPQEPPTYPPTA